jgi:SRSO17 transposase
MNAVFYRIYAPKLDIRQFLAALRDAFTTRPDGHWWPRAGNTWRIAPAYIKELIRPVSHMTFRDIGKRLSINEHRVRWFISESPWEHGAVQVHLNEHIPETIASPEAMLIADDVDILKNGHNSAGVKPQYPVSLSNVSSCQVGVDCVLAVPGDHLPS